MIPLTRGIKSSQTHRNRKQNRSCQGLVGGGSGELLFHGHRISILEDDKSSGDGWWRWLQNNVNILKNG